MDWTKLTPDQILADLNGLRDQTEGFEKPPTIFFLTEGEIADAAKRGILFHRVEF